MPPTGKPRTWVRHHRYQGITRGTTLTGTRAVLVCMKHLACRPQENHGLGSDITDTRSHSIVHTRPTNCRARHGGGAGLHDEFLLPPEARMSEEEAIALGSTKSMMGPSCLRRCPRKGGRLGAGKHKVNDESLLPLEMPTQGRK
eukprot:1138775-Pelagomonas_calceolata.AAC.1